MHCFISRKLAIPLAGIHNYRPWAIGKGSILIHVCLANREAGCILLPLYGQFSQFYEDAEIME